VQFGAATNKQSALHFTVKITNQFQAIVDQVKPTVEKKLDTAIVVDYSFQNRVTDTIAVEKITSL
jgi:hypothetical protein